MDQGRLRLGYGANRSHNKVFELRAQQQDPGHPAARLRLAQRGVSTHQNSHLHAAGAIARRASIHLPRCARPVPSRPIISCTSASNLAVDMIDNVSALPTCPTTTTAKAADNHNRLEKRRSRALKSSRLARSHQAASVSFTAATSCLSVNGFGRKANWPCSGRCFWKASSA